MFFWLSHHYDNPNPEKVICDPDSESVLKLVSETNSRIFCKSFIQPKILEVLFKTTQFFISVFESCGNSTKLISSLSATTEYSRTEQDHSIWYYWEFKTNCDCPHAPFSLAFQQYVLHPFISCQSVYYSYYCIDQSFYMSLHLGMLEFIIYIQYKSTLCFTQLMFRVRWLSLYMSGKWVISGCCSIWETSVIFTVSKIKSGPHLINSNHFDVHGLTYLSDSKYGYKSFQ